MARVIVYDLEIAKPLPQRDGKADWDAAKRGECGVSCVVLYDSETNRYHLYDSHNLVDCITHLNSADWLVGWNSKEFDTNVMQGVTGQQITAKQYDILQAIWQALGNQYFKGYRLGDVANRTLGLNKTGNGESAPSLAAQGRWAELFDYCLNDVWLTKELFNHAIEYGWIIDANGEKLALSPPSEEFI